jgi:hypothetical protein
MFVIQEENVQDQTIVYVILDLEEKIVKISFVTEQNPTIPKYALVKEFVFLLINANVSLDILESFAKKISSTALEEMGQIH